MNEVLSLIEDCKTGDRKSQELLFRQYYPLAMRIALRYATDEQEAADILSHSFIKIFKSLGSFDSNKGSFEGWMHRLVINESLNAIKRKERFKVAEWEEKNEEAPVYNKAIAGMDAEYIMHKVQQLPPATKAVFLLYAVDGYLHKEIAEMLGISEGTSKWHLSEARKILKNKLSQKAI